jgi:hypothetical protein
LTIADTRLKKAKEELAQASQRVIIPRNEYRAAVDGKCEEAEAEIRQLVSHKSTAIMTVGVGTGGVVGVVITGASAGGMVGSVFPGAGTAIGAVVGALIGLAAIGISWLYIKTTGASDIGEVLGEKSRIQAISRQE